MKTFFAIVLLLFETAVAGALVCGLVFFYRFSHNLPDVSDLVNDVRPSVATTIYSQDNVLLGKLDVENRQPVALSDIAPDVINSTLAIEDHRFYQHFGVDVQGIARAAWADMQGETTRQGASTLTQQLLRTIGLFGLSHEKRYSRKIREALLAVRIEQMYTKREILALYLNNVYYGGGAYGVQAAAKTYFGKSASALDLAQSALLAGLPQRPSYYYPFEHPRAALNRRDEVLDALQRYGYITEQQCEDAKAEALHLQPQRKHRDYNFKAPYFVWYVLNALKQKYGPDYVYSGIRIETTLNWKMQQTAEHAVIHGLENSGAFGCNQGCLICLDNSSGSIRAMVGGRSFLASQYNHVTQGKRQPGSTFKLFDYAAAFDEGKCTIDDTFVDQPVDYPHSHGKQVHDFEGWSYRSMSCRTAIQNSINTIAVQVAQLVGIEQVIAYAHRLGITSELAPYYPTAIGASAVHPIDLCVAYSVVANSGTKHHPVGVSRIVESDGTVHEEEAPPPETDLLKKETIDQLNDGLQAVVMHGTGIPARGNESNGVVDGARGKTGTTSDFRDAWFAGFTPELTTVIWVGSEHRDRHGIVSYARMGTATGGVVCGPIWHDFMIQAVPVQQRYLQSLQIVQASADASHAGDPFKAQPKNTGKPATTRPQDRPLKPVAAPNGDASSTSNNPPVVPTEVQPGVANVANPGPVSSQGTTAPPPPDPEPPPVITRTTAPVSDTGAGLIQKKPSHVDVDELVDVDVCVDTRERATMWCPATVKVKMSRSKARHLKRCTMHRPPP